MGFNIFSTYKVVSNLDFKVKNVSSSQVSVMHTQAAPVFLAIICSSSSLGNKFLMVRCTK